MVIIVLVQGKSYTGREPEFLSLEGMCLTLHAFEVDIT